MGSQFPNFKRLKLEDRAEIEVYTKNFPPYSDYNFVSLYSYNVSESIEFCYLNTNLVIKFENYITGENFFSFLGTSKVKETADLLISSVKDLGINSHLGLLPKDNFAYQGQFDGLIMEEDRDNFDYILLLSSLSSLEGGEYHDKRNLANRFKKENPDASVKLLNLKDNRIREEMLELFKRWAEQKKDAGTEHEERAIKRLLDASDSFSLVSLGIYKNNQIIAWTIAETLSNSWSISHFAKADINFRGIFEAQLRELAGELIKRNCSFLNYEQDLGIEGLKRSKELWRPVSFLKKYTIRKK